MTVIVIGCGRVGAELAGRLGRQGHRVTVVDLDPASFEQLSPDFRGRTVVGDCLAREVLERAGIASCDGVAVVTNSDSVNAVTAHIVRTVFGVSRVVARNYDPARRPVFEAFGVPVVSTGAWVAEQVEDLLAHGALRLVHRVGDGAAGIYELVVPPGWAGRSLVELLPAEAAPVALIRAGRGMVATAEQTLMAGDRLLVSATREAAAQLEAALGQSEG